VKSLGAKTNHLPNIQGLAGQAASTGRGWNKNSDRKGGSESRSNNEVKLILSEIRESGFL
jgi:hypothetical protein